MAKPGRGKRKMTANWKKQHRKGDKLLKKILNIIFK